MAKKLTIKGIKFPDFGDDDSKKNFRLVFYVGYTDKDGNEEVAVIAKPSERHWQWRNKDKDAYLKPKVSGDSVKLDTLMLKSGDGGKIAKGSNLIAEIDGEITDVSVQFMDVHDKTPIDIFTKSILPELITAWKALGIDPIDLIPVPIPGGIKTKIKEKIDINKMIDGSKDFFTKKLKDKVLHSIGTEYDGEDPLVLEEGDVEWSKGKTGTYSVTVDFS